MNSPTRIFIIEDHPSVTNGYIQWLNGHNDLLHVGDATHPKQAIGQLHAIAELPDVLIMDFSFPNEDTILPYIEKLRELAPLTGMMVITSHDRPDILRKIVAANMDGILTKDEGQDGFIQCIRSVVAGGSYQGKRVREALRTISPAKRAYDSLTQTEKRVLQLLATGKPDKHLTDLLGIAESTLDNHRTAIFTKLRAQDIEVHAKAELAVWYAQHQSQLG